MVLEMTAGVNGYECPDCGQLISGLAHHQSVCMGGYRLGVAEGDAIPVGQQLEITVEPDYSKLLGLGLDELRLLRISIQRMVELLGEMMRQDMEPGLEESEVESLPEGVIEMYCPHCKGKRTTKVVEQPGEPDEYYCMVCGQEIVEDKAAECDHEWLEVTTNFDAAGGQKRWLCNRCGEATVSVWEGDE